MEAFFILKSKGGRTEISAAPEGRGIKINSNFIGVQVQQISALQQLSDHEISGGLGGNIVYATGRTSGKLSGDLNMTNCRVELAAAIFNQDLYELKNIDTDLAL